MAEGGSRRRNLRPRKQFVAEEPSFPSTRRHLRQSRSRVKPDDFLVFANEDDVDYGDHAGSADEAEDVEASDEEVENSLKTRRTKRTSRRNTGRAARNSSRSTRGTPRSSSARTKSGNRSSRNTVLPSSSRSARASRRRGNLDIDVVMEDAAAQDDSSSYSSQEEDEEDDIEDEENDLEDDGELEFGKVRELFRNKRTKRRAPKVLLPEDVPLRPPYPDQPLEDPVDIQHTPSIAFLAVFVATFYDLFADFGVLPSPQDLEEGLISEEPSPLVELLFRRLLLLVLNRKKELEVGRYGSALSELHSLRGILGQGPWFPPLNWKSRASAFQELNWADRVELLHVLVHWSMANSDRVKALLKNIGEELTMPWMGADEHGNHYYIVGFDPVAENSQEYTRFRVYKESNRLLSNVSWKPVASSAAEVVEFLKQHQIKEELNDEAETNYEDTKPGNEAKEETRESISEEPEEVKYQTDTAKLHQPAVDTAPETIPGETVPGISSDPSKYNLPATVVEILTNLLPSMRLSEEVTSARIARENKRARRRNFLWHPEPINRDEGRHRRRRNRVDFFDFVRQNDGIDDVDDSNRKRRRRDEPWTESEPETRQQRHARLLADKQERIQSEPAEDVTDAAEHATSVALETQPMPTEAQPVVPLGSAPLPPTALLPTPPMIPAVQEKLVEPTIATNINPDLNK